MKVITYIMRKKDNKYIITRYIFEEDKLIDKFWVNTYYDKKSAKDYFNIIFDIIEYYHHKILRKCFGNNIWEVSYK